MPHRKNNKGAKDGRSRKLLGAPPTLSVDAGRHADWLELAAVLSPDKFLSWAAYRKSLEATGSIDAIPVRSEGADGDEQMVYETLIDEIAAELDYRREYCGGEDAYPFMLDSQGLQLRATDGSPTYQFLLLLSALHNPAARIAGRHGPKLFEEISASALRNYLGVDNEFSSVEVFGFPRRVLPPSFRGALDEICRRLGEGEGAREVPRRADQKDAALDVIGWKGFRDRKSSQLIVFGHCASGSYWSTKATEINPRSWCKLWLNRMPDVDPVGAFFVPYVVEDSEWTTASVLGGILFDRCRITWLLPALPVELAGQVDEWTSGVTERAGREVG